MKNAFSIIFFLFCCQTSVGQPNPVDSLVARLKALPDNEQRFPVLEKLSSGINNYRSAQTYALEGLKLAKKLNQPKMQVKFLYLLTTALNNAADYPSTIATAFDGLRLSQNLNDGDHIIQFLRVIAMSYGEMKENKRCLDYFYKALNTASEQKDTLSVVSMLSYLESEYADIEKPDSARVMAYKEYNIVLNSKDKKVRRQMAYAYGDLGEMQSAFHHADSALMYYRKALPLLNIEKDEQLISYTDNLLAKIYLTTARPDSARKYALEGFRLANQTRRLPWVADAALILSQLYEGKDNAKSLYYYKAAMAARDSVSGGDKANRFQTAIYTEQHRQEELKNAAISYHNKVRLLISIGALFLVAAVGLMLWIVNRRQRKANQILIEQKQQVEDTLRQLKLTQTQLIQFEKMASLGELTAGIAHEIQNPLNFVNNFSEVNKEMIAELKEELKNGNLEDVLAIATDIEQNEDKINHHGKRADAIVKGMLEHSRVGTGEKQLTDLNALADEFLKLSYHGLRAKDKDFNAVPIAIGMITHFDTNLPKANVSQQDIGRVMLNLFNNAFYTVNQKLKASGADYKPAVEVTTFAPPSGGWGVKVRDNGNGIPDAIKDKIMQPFFTTKPTGEGTGLGLSLSYDIVVKGHGGKIDINSTPGEGATFTITLPIEK